MKKYRSLPVPGQRIIRTVIAVWLCLAVYELRGRQGLPIFSLIAVLSGIQPYTKTMRTVAKEKIVGTLIGALWGLVMITLELALAGEGMTDGLVHYLLVGLFTGVTIYFTVLIKIANMASFSAVVFLCIAINQIQGGDPYIYAFNRLLDTAIGLVIAEIVNRVQLPRARNTDTLFISTIGHTILGGGSELSPYSKVELNRLIEDGAKFTISTKQSQATVRQLLGGVDLRYPIITLDGAAIYDMQKMEYLRTVPMSSAQAEQIMRWARQEQLPFFCNVIQDNLLIIRYSELTNEAMQEMFADKRSSPYRSFVKSPVDAYEDVVRVSILDRTEKIEAAYEKLKDQPWSGEYRAVKSRFYLDDRYSFLRFYDASVSREAMTHELEAIMGTKKTVTFGSVRGECDVYIENADRNTVVKELRRRFEPVDFRNWKTCFRT